MDLNEIIQEPELNKIDELVYQKIYEKFDRYIQSLVINHIKQETDPTKRKITEDDINRLVYTMKVIYKNPEAFKYTFERYYSHPHNPFTNAYCDFMNWYNNGHGFNEIFYNVIKGILKRLIKEEKEKDNYTIF